MWMLRVEFDHYPKPKFARSKYSNPFFSVPKFILYWNPYPYSWMWSYGKKEKTIS
ncbi:hypothetical protein DNHGIG_25610 [Collibacillus ludicampi]|uniref:Uncharacterized protein n=1 Tax=Collibacillus ludicampi TaxID=2771369 RepID=A0AAV4LGR2_9BACL|nr:hypothetical protein DNHGIG_25610 [Collibacillus ludicampi]